MSAPVTLKFSVSPSVAARAGIDQHGDLSVEVRPSVLTQPARDVLSVLLRERAIYPTLTQRVLDADGAASLVTVPPAPMPPTTATIEAWIETLAAALADKRAADARESEARIQKALAAPDEQWIRQGTGEPYYVLRSSGSDEYSDTGGSPVHRPIVGLGLGLYLTEQELRDPRVVARRQRVAADTLVQAQAAWQRRHDEWTAWKAARQQAAADAVQARAKARQEQIDAFLARAPEPLRKRHARGLLPEQDLLAAMRDEVFAPLADLPRLQRLRDDEVRRELDADSDAEVSYSTEDAETATDGDIALIERIEALMPGAEAKLRVHTASIDGIDETVTRYSVRVAARSGAFEFSREYAADAP